MNKEYLKKRNIGYVFFCIALAVIYFTFPHDDILVPLLTAAFLFAVYDIYIMVKTKKKKNLNTE